MRIPIPDLLIRLREEAQRSPTEKVSNPLRGQGASHNLGEQLAWRTFNGIFSGKKIYRTFGWAATRFRSLTPNKQLGWTQNHIPLQPAAKTLHELIAERNKNR